MSNKPKPVVLIVLDGWGYREDPDSNAIYHAKKPTWDRVWNQYPHTLIYASEKAVGLPDKQMGNSEVGHLNLGAGRVVYQEFSRVLNGIENGSFFNNKALATAVDKAVAANKAVHILGLLSDGGVHSHELHIHGMVELALRRGAKKVYVHAFLDGRDTPPKSAQASIDKMEAEFKRLGGGRFASVVGRYFAMDRDNRWARVKQAYDVICHGRGTHVAQSASNALNAAYERGETDEFVASTAIVPTGTRPVTVEDGDAMIFMNFRSDRARQLTKAFIDDQFDGFDRGTRPQLASFTTLTQYSEDFGVPVAFPPEPLRNVFGAYISELGLRQLRIAETEKYAHVTFFLNGGVEEPFPGEDRILVSSPNVATYDLKPEMSAREVTEKLVEAVEGNKYDVMICNFANPDMVGHSGNFDATVKAIEVLDECLGKVISAVTKAGGELIITADHGNAEMMTNNETGQAHTAHTLNPVPFLYIGRSARMSSSGALSDVVPTMLYLMGLPKPKEMTGESLVQLLH